MLTGRNPDIYRNDPDKCQCLGPGFCLRHCVTKNSNEYRKCRFSEEHRISMDFDVYGEKFSLVPKEIIPSIQIATTKLKSFTPNIDLSDSKIFILGQKNAPEMSDNMEYFNLESEDYGKYKKYAIPDLAEARFYFSKKAIPKTKVFGSLTASWDKKFSGKNKLSNFYKWKGVEYLPRVTLCAHRAIFSPYTDNPYFAEFLENRNLNHPVGFGIWANQIVCSGELFLELTLFMREALIDLLDLYHKKDILSGNKDIKYYQKIFANRIIALFAEEISARWFASKKDLIILSCEQINTNWYKDWELPSTYWA